MIACRVYVKTSSELKHAVRDFRHQNFYITGCLVSESDYEYFVVAPRVYDLIVLRSPRFIIIYIVWFS